MVRTTIVTIALLMAAPALGQTTTDCTHLGNTTSCTTNSAPQPNQDLLNLIARGGPNTYADMVKSGEAERITPDDRRAAAYNQVGELIAKGDCAGATRLAAFYGRKDIMKDTARACPLP